MGDLVLTHEDQGRHGVKELRFQAMETRMRALERERLEPLSSLANLALTYRYQRRWREAEELGVQVMELSVRFLGEEHPETLASIVNLARTYQSQGREKEAEELEAQVMEIRTRIAGGKHGEEDSFASTSVYDLASTIWEQSQRRELKSSGGN